jgi:hypothetical protein
MYAVVFEADSVPMCVRVEGVSPDPIVTWTSEEAARAYIEAKGMGAEFEATAVDDASLERMPLEPYPG